MDDLDALREALDRIDHPSDDETAESMGADFDRAIAAARAYLRLMEGAETVWYCNHHRKPSDHPKWCNRGITHPEPPCRMVKADLHVHSESGEI